MCSPTVPDRVFDRVFHRTPPPVDSVSPDPVSRLRLPDSVSPDSADPQIPRRPIELQELKPEFHPRAREYERGAFAFGEG